MDSIEFNINSVTILLTGDKCIIWEGNRKTAQRIEIPLRELNQALNTSGMLKKKENIPYMPVASVSGNFIR